MKNFSELKKCFTNLVQEFDVYIFYRLAFDLLTYSIIVLDFIALFFLSMSYTSI